MIAFEGRFFGGSFTYMHSRLLTVQEPHLGFRVSHLIFRTRQNWHALMALFGTDKLAEDAGDAAVIPLPEALRPRHIDSQKALSIERSTSPRDFEQRK